MWFVLLAALVFAVTLTNTTITSEQPLIPLNFVFESGFPHLWVEFALINPRQENDYKLIGNSRNEGGESV